jgi:hypothetical protein
LLSVSVALLESVVAATVGPKGGSSRVGTGWALSLG